MAVSSHFPASEPCRVTVVGAGIVGVACALCLQQDGHRVTMVDRDPPGEGCSRGNAGIIATEAIQPLITPSLLLKLPGMLLDPLGPLAIDWRHLPFMLPWMLRFLLNARPRKVAENRGHLAALLRHAAAAYRPLLALDGVERLIRRNGWITVYETERAFQAAAGERNLLPRYGIPHATLDRARLRERLPELTPAVRHGVYYPEAFNTIDPHRLVRLLADHFGRRGGHIQRARVSAITGSGDGPRLVTDAGAVTCDRIVVAAGAWSGALARSAGDRIPLDTERGYHLMVEGAGIEPAMPVMSGEHHFVTTPMRKGLRLAGTSELAGLKRPPNYARAEVLLGHARRLWPGLRGQVVERWMGFRPTLPDSLPVLGPSPRVRGLYYAFGHQHLGLTLAAISGRLISECIGGRPETTDLAPYRADRF